MFKIYFGKSKKKKKNPYSFCKYSSEISLFALSVCLWKSTRHVIFMVKLYLVELYKRVFVFPSITREIHLDILSKWGFKTGKEAKYSPRRQRDWSSSKNCEDRGEWALQKLHNVFIFSSHRESAENSVLERPCVGVKLRLAEIAVRMVFVSFSFPSLFFSSSTSPFLFLGNLYLSI